MHGTKLLSLVVAVAPAVAPLFAFPSTASPKLPSTGRVYVVALKGSPLFITCPTAVQISTRLPQRTILEGVPSLSVFLDSFRYTDLEQEIRAELARQARYRPADSLEQADLVLIVEAREAAAGSTGRVGGGSVTFPGDPNFLTSALAIIVPAELFGSAATDVPSLLKGALWRGGVSARTDRARLKLHEASLAELVSLFVKNDLSPERWPRFCPTPPWLDGHTVPDPAPSPRGLKNEGSEPVSPIPSARSSDHAPGTIQVDVTLVTVPVLVSDVVGRYVAGLDAAAFRLYEDGLEQNIDRVLPEAEPFHVALLLDISGSTRFKLTDIQEAALRFVEALRPDDRILVVSFGSQVFVDSEFTEDRERLLRAIRETRTIGNTRLHDAVHLVLKERLAGVAGRKAMVLFTDGVDTASRVVDAAGSVSRVEESNVVLYAIQYDTRSDLNSATAPAGAPPGTRQGGVDVEAMFDRATRYLTRLSDGGGGRLYQAGTIQDLNQAFAAIAEELRQQYTICYYPSNPAKDGAFRRIRVQVDQDDARVRARAGYRAPATQP